MTRAARLPARVAVGLDAAGGAVADGELVGDVGGGGGENQKCWLMAQPSSTLTIISQLSGPKKVKMPDPSSASARRPTKARLPTLTATSASKRPACRHSFSGGQGAFAAGRSTAHSSAPCSPSSASKKRRSPERAKFRGFAAAFPARCRSAGWCLAGCRRKGKARCRRPRRRPRRPPGRRRAEKISRSGPRDEEQAGPDFQHPGAGRGAVGAPQLGARYDIAAAEEGLAAVAGEVGQLEEIVQEITSGAGDVAREEVFRSAK